MNNESQRIINAQELYNLLRQQNIIGSNGEIIFNFLNLAIKINQKSAIGDLFQEWLAE